MTSPTPGWSRYAIAAIVFGLVAIGISFTWIQLESYGFEWVYLIANRVKDRRLDKARLK